MQEEPTPSVSVDFRVAAKDLVYRQPLVVNYRIRNDSDNDVFFVRDRLYVLCNRDAEAEICDVDADPCVLECYMAERDHTWAGDSTGFAIPLLKRLRSRTSFHRKLRILLPPTLLVSRIDGSERRLQVHMAERVALEVTVGYGTSPYRPDLSSLTPAADFIEWQQLATSQRTCVTVRRQND